MSTYFPPDSSGQRLLDYALTLPEAWVDTPWDESPVVKVRKKIFVFLGAKEHLSMSAKLPVSMMDVLELPHARPTGYGLGRHGWCSLNFEGIDVPEDQVKAWIRESYRAVAPKTLARLVEP